MGVGDVGGGGGVYGGGAGGEGGDYGGNGDYANGNGANMRMIMMLVMVGVVLGMAMVVMGGEGYSGRIGGSGSLKVMEMMTLGLVAVVIVRRW